MSMRPSQAAPVASLGMRAACAVNVSNSGGMFATTRPGLLSAGLIGARNLTVHPNAKKVKYMDKVRKKGFPHPRDIMQTWRILKGDMVELIKGDERGKQGKILKVFRKRNKVIIEGINIRTLVYTNTNGSTRTTVAPLSIHYSNVALVDPSTGQKCKVKYMFQEDGTKVRVAKKSGEIIPYNCITPRKNEAYELDTPADLVTQATFEGR